MLNILQSLSTSTFYDVGCAARQAGLAVWALYRGVRNQAF